MFGGERSKSRRFERIDDNMNTREPLETVNNNGYRVFFGPLQSVFLYCENNTSIARHQNIRLTKSAFVSCCIAHSVTYKARKGFVLYISMMNEGLSESGDRKNRFTAHQ